jgi:hypothetical protein
MFMMAEKNVKDDRKGLFRMRKNNVHDDRK